MLIAVCVLSPAHLEHVLGITSFRVHFGGVLRGRFVPRTCFDRVLAGTVLAGTRLFRTRSDNKKWFLPRTCSENMFPLELYREQVWMLGTWLWKHWYQHMEKLINTAYHQLRVRKAVELTAQRCSIENQKGAITVQSLWHYSTLLVLNGTLLNSNNALLVLSWR